MYELTHRLKEPSRANRAEDLEMKNAEIEETESNKKSKQLTIIAEEEECVLNMV